MRAVFLSRLTGPINTINEDAAVPRRSAVLTTRAAYSPGSELGISGLCPAVMPVILGISPAPASIYGRNKNLVRRSGRYDGGSHYLTERVQSLREPKTIQPANDFSLSLSGISPPVVLLVSSGQPGRAPRSMESRP